MPIQPTPFTAGLKWLWQQWWAGLFLLIPATVTLYLLWQLFLTLEGLGQDLLLPLGILPRPGLSLIAMLILILLTGAVTTHYVGRRFVTWADRTMERTPIVRSIYLTLKGMTDLLNYRERFGKTGVVMFPFPREGTWALGLVMGSSPPVIVQATNGARLMVFVPTAIHPFTGYLAFLPTEVATRLDLSLEDVMKMQFSAGLYRPSRTWIGTTPTDRPTP
ncbi:MAG: DUF502 domain-containing protein [Nitrospiraceae bacterium]